MGEERIAMLTASFSIGAVTCQITNMHHHIKLPGQGGFGLPIHKHSHLELHYIAQGECTFWVEQSTVNLHAGQLLLVPPGTYHKMSAFSPDLSRSAIPVSMSLADNAPAPDRYFHQTLCDRSPAVLDVADTALEEAIRRIHTLLRQKTYHSDYAQLGRFRAFCSLILLELFEQLDMHSEQSLSPNADLPSRVFQIDEWLSIWYNQNVSAETLAQKLNISTRQLNRVMKQTYGLNFRDKIAQLRTEVAVTLLTTTQRSVAEIAEELGYDSPSNFTVFIKKSTGKTPSQIRKESR